MELVLIAILFWVWIRRWHLLNVSVKTELEDYRDSICRLQLNKLTLLFKIMSVIFVCDTFKRALLQAANGKRCLKLLSLFFLHLFSPSDLTMCLSLTPEFYLWTRLDFRRLRSEFGLWLFEDSSGWVKRTTKKCNVSYNVATKRFELRYYAFYRPRSNLFNLLCCKTGFL